MGPSARPARRVSWRMTYRFARQSILVCILMFAPQPSMLAQRGQPGGPALAPVADPRALVAQGIRAMGGQARLAALSSVRIDAMGIEYHLEQSERPEGPWLTSYTQRTELRDHARGRVRQQIQTRNWSRPAWSPASSPVLVSDGTAIARQFGERWLPGGVADRLDVADTLELSSERLLLTALAAPDLRAVAGRTLQGTPNDAVAFTWRSRPVTLFLNRWTKMPTLLELVRPDQWGVWGDVTERRWFSWWDLQKGVWIARQVTTEWNGYPYRDLSLLSVTVDDPVDDKDFTIPEETARAFADAVAKPVPSRTPAIDDAKLIELAPGVVQVPSGYNILFVKQPDGLVVIEATTSSEFSKAVIATAGKKFPGVPIKAVVTTSDAWPHIGGIREYVARRIPVYALDLNVPILDRLIRAPRTTAPDALATAPVAPVWKPVASRTTIGSGDTRIELVPVRGEIGERMMLALMPGLKIGYTSDLVQRARAGGFFMPGMLAEVTRAIERERLDPPERIVGMHLAPTPYQEIVDAVAAVIKP